MSPVERNLAADLVPALDRYQALFKTKTKNRAIQGPVMRSDLQQGFSLEDFRGARRFHLCIFDLID